MPKKISDIIRSAAAKPWAKDPIGPFWAAGTRNVVKELFQHAKKKNQGETLRSLGALVNYCAQVARDVGHKEFYAPLNKLGDDLITKGEQAGAKRLF